jgi:hypothetical protein
LSFYERNLDQVSNKKCTKKLWPNREADFNLVLNKKFPLVEAYSQVFKFCATACLLGGD